MHSYWQSLWQALFSPHNVFYYAKYEANYLLAFYVTHMQKHVQKKKENPCTVVGTWFNADEYETEVEYIVSCAGWSYAVRAVDRFDSEDGDVYDVKWDGDALSFAVHWNSTGRLIKARLLVISPNRVDYTYTYTQQEMWHRKKTEQSAPPNRRPARRSATRTSQRGGGR